MERMSPYANLAVTAGGISTEVGYIFGVDFGVTSKVSVATDIVGRRLLDVADYTETTGPYVPNPAFTITLPAESGSGIESRLVDDWCEGEHRAHIPAHRHSHYLVDEGWPARSLYAGRRC